MLDATRLRVLVAVARHGSVTGAAQALNYAQPSISHHMARLEAETGAKLMERSGRGIRLTDAGQLLAGRAEEILGRLDAAEAELAAHLGQRHGRVRLAAFGAAIGTLVPAAAACLRAEMPNAELELTQAEPQTAERMLRAGLADVALTFEYQLAGSRSAVGAAAAADAEPDGLRRRLVLDEPVYLVTPPELAAGDCPLIPDLAGQRWISGRGGDRDLVIAQCASAGRTPEIAFSTDDHGAALSLVASGFGVAMLPGLALRLGPRPGVSASVLPGVRHQVFAVTYGAPPDPPQSALLIGALIRSASAAAPAS